MDTMKYEALGASLAAAGFDTVLDAARTACAHAHAAWVEDPLPRNIVDLEQGMLLAPVHQGVSCSYQATGRLRDLVDQLAASEMVRIVDGNVYAGAWQLTSYHGILAVRDRAASGEDSKVYIGEDSLHFVDWLASAPAAAAALDIGAGSGISTVALSRRARHVTAVDIDEDCCRAVPVTAALNAAADRIQTVRADVTAGLDLDRRFDVVVGNAPGVPIPPGIHYSPAGNGGADGLRVSRAVLEQLPHLLADGGTAMLKFESAGGDEFPIAQHLLREMAEQHGWSALYVQHSRIPMEARAAISARWAAPLNPHRSPDMLLDKFDQHSGAIGATQFYTCSVQVRARGDGRLTVLPVFGQREWVPARDVRSRLAKTRPVAGEKLAHAYLERVRMLPDGLWELDVRKFLFTPLKRAAALLDAVRDTRTFGDGVRAAFAGEMVSDPIHARCLYALSAILMDAYVATQNGEDAP